MLHRWVLGCRSFTVEYVMMMIKIECSFVSATKLIDSCEPESKDNSMTKNISMKKLETSHQVMKRNALFFLLKYSNAYVVPIFIGHLKCFVPIDSTRKIVKNNESKLNLKINYLFCSVERRPGSLNLSSLRIWRVFVHSVKDAKRERVNVTATYPNPFMSKPFPLRQIILDSHSIRLVNACFEVVTIDWFVRIKVFGICLFWVFGWYLILALQYFERVVLCQNAHYYIVRYCQMHSDRFHWNIWTLKKHQSNPIIHIKCRF